MDISLLEHEKIMVIIRHHKKFAVTELVKTVSSVGLHFFEITMNTPGALELIKEAGLVCEEKMMIGAGTVLSIEEVQAAIDHGARFIVSPITDVTLIEYCQKKNIPVFPGAYTPTEAHTAYSAGAYMVKIFPSSAGGPKYIKTIKAPLDKVKLMAVGGINPENINDYLSVGASAVGIGAGTVKREWIDSMQYDKIKTNLKLLKENIED